VEEEVTIKEEEIAKTSEEEETAEEVTAEEEETAKTSEEEETTA